MQVGELFVKLSLDMNNFKTQLDNAGVSLKSASDKMKSIGQTMSLAVTAPILGAGAASFKMAADFNDALGATDQIFRDASGTMKEWAGGLETYYGIAEGKALEYSNMMGTMLMNIGGQTEAEAAKQSQTLVQLAGDLTAMFGGTTESAVQALTGALKGNNTMLDNYGISATEAQIQSKALELGLIAEGESMDAASKQAATLALIMEQTSAAQGQASREAEGASGQMRTFSTEMQNLGKQLGEILLPMITPIIEKLNEMAQKFQELSPETQKTIIVIAGIAAAIGPLLVVLGTLGSAIAGISAAMPVMGTVIAGISAPIAIAIAAVVALIAIGVALWKNWDEIKAKAQEIWDNIKTKLSKDLDDITTRFAKLKDDIVNKWNEMWENVKTFLANAIQSIVTKIVAFISIFITKWEEMKENVKRKWDEMWKYVIQAISNAWNGIVNALNAIGSNMSNWFSDLANKARDWGSNMIQGFVDGIRSMIGKVRDVSSQVTRAVGDFIGFNSPSKKGEGRNIVKWGKNMVSGFEDGIIQAMPDLQKTMSAAIPAMGSIGGSGSVSNSYGGVTVQNMTVRNDGDIDLIAKKLFDLQTKKGRGLGIA